MTITITGRVPSKKNSKRIVMAGSRPMIISSKDYETWHTTASYELRLQMPRNLILSEPHKVSITLYAPNKVKGDLTNKAESIMDLLVDNGVIEDDNWFEVSHVSLTFGGVDKEDPRAAVEIEAA